MSSFYHSNSSTSLHLSSISTNEFLWLPYKNASQIQQQFFGNQRCNVYSPFLFLAEYGSKKLKNKPKIVSQWILCDHKQVPFMWAEVQVCKSTFTVINITFGQLPEISPSFLEEAIGLFISSQILSYEPDITKMTTPTKSPHILEKVLKDITNQKVWVPNWEYFILDTNTSGYWNNYWMCTSSEWWSIDINQGHKKRLNYISKRKSKVQKKIILQSKKPPRSRLGTFLSRLFKKKS